MCQRVCLIEDEGLVANEESVYVFRSANREAAVQRFLELARKQDKEYLNGEGKRVRWALVSLDTVDELSEGPLRDREVFSKITELASPDPSIPFDRHFTPEKSEPG